MQEVTHLFGTSVSTLQNIPWLAWISSWIVIGGYYYYVTRYNYWSKIGVKGVHPMPIIGEIYTVLTTNRLETERNNVKKYGKIYGTFLAGQPRLVIADAQVLRQICIKDFDAFPDHQTNFWANKYQRFFLIWLHGDYWKKVRSMMSPAFTSGKIKRMFKFIDGCADDLIAILEEQVLETCDSEGAIVNLKVLYETYSMNGIATCGYGLKLPREKIAGTNTKSIATRDDFIRQAKRVLEFKNYRLAMLTIIPKFILKLFGFRISPEKEFEPFVQRIDKLVKMRQISTNSTKRYDDLLQLLIDAKFGDKVELNDMDKAENHHASLTHVTLVGDQEKMIEELKAKGDLNERSPSKPIRLSHIEILSESIFLLAAGYETTSALLTNVTYALAFHPEVQEKLYSEVSRLVKYDESTKHHEFEYDSLTSCQYLDSVISETLRMLTPAPQVDRVAARDYYIEKYNIHVPKGSLLMLGLYAVQNDSDYWDKPEIFDPERFMPGNKEKIVPGSYAPFSMGPRHCIGMRFSLTEAKLGLAKVIMKFEFKPAPGTAFPPQPARRININSIQNPHVKLISRRE